MSNTSTAGGAFTLQRIRERPLGTASGWLDIAFERRAPFRTGGLFRVQVGVVSSALMVNQQLAPWYVQETCARCPITEEAMTSEPYVPPRFPISIKGVVLDDEGRVLLLKNERAEWELPGGKMESGEAAPDRVAQEILEGSGWRAEAGPVLDVCTYQPLPGRYVFIVTYGCHRLDGASAPPVVSGERREARLFRRDEVPSLVMSDGYKASIERWYEHSDRR
ncbi:NUDIX domain-containing protein [Kitasatospora sp. NPDC088351]|uniref:NUDIX domain-containing protein n=1 Tax=unclassified Kitasatospora TaxID=2633591 RepID=UPI003432123B